MTAGEGIVADGYGPQVAYKNGANEKLLGDFIKKHNVREKLFGEHNSVLVLY